MVNWIIIRDAHPQNFTYRHHIGLSRVIMQISHAWVTTTSIIELKYSKSNLCRSKEHQFYFFILFLSFCLRVICKGLRKNWEIFVNLRRSSGQSMRERSDRWSEFLVFKSVPGCIEGIPGHYGMFGGIMGCSRGVPGLFRAVPGCSGGVPGVFRGVPGVFRGVPGCSGCVPGFTDTLGYLWSASKYFCWSRNCDLSTVNMLLQSSDFQLASHGKLA